MLQATTLIVFVLNTCEAKEVSTSTCLLYSQKSQWGRNPFWFADYVKNSSLNKQKHVFPAVSKPPQVKWAPSSRAPQVGSVDEAQETLAYRILNIYGCFFLFKGLYQNNDDGYKEK